MNQMSETTTSPIYLAETRVEDDTPHLHLFSAGQLAGFLARNIEDWHYSGYGHDVLALFRYDIGGTLAPLTWRCTGREYDRADDWVYLDYEVRASGATCGGAAPVAEVGFTVRIDGRA